MKPSHIVVIKNGWVFAGTLVSEKNASILRFADSVCIRSWGTTQGLGQLALSGPTKDTVLEESGALELPVSALLFTLDVIATKNWV